MRGLTSLFGMGRGEHPRQNHHKIFAVFVLSAGCFADIVTHSAIRYILGSCILSDKIKLKLTGN